MSIMYPYTVKNIIVLFQDEKPTLERPAIEDQVGSLKPGLSADLIAVVADPLADINELKKVVFVMREGVVYKNSL